MRRLVGLLTLLSVATACNGAAPAPAAAPRAAAPPATGEAYVVRFVFDGGYAMVFDSVNKALTVAAFDGGGKPHEMEMMAVHGTYAGGLRADDPHNLIWKLAKKGTAYPSVSVDASMGMTTGLGTRAGSAVPGCNPLPSSQADNLSLLPRIQDLASCPASPARRDTCV